jgi:hypothetical protein
MNRLTIRYGSSVLRPELVGRIVTSTAAAFITGVDVIPVKDEFPDDHTGGDF